MASMRPVTSLATVCWAAISSTSTLQLRIPVANSRRRCLLRCYPAEKQLNPELIVFLVASMRVSTALLQWSSYLRSCSTSMHFRSKRGLLQFPVDLEVLPQTLPTKRCCLQLAFQFVAPSRGGSSAANTQAVEDLLALHLSPSAPMP